MPVPGSVEARSRDYYDRLADDYDRQMDTARARGMRECFWQRAEALLQGPSRLLDFGAGTGIDAEHFAGRGHQVTAYDLSEGMLEALRRRCAALVAAGSVVPVAGPLDEARPALTAGAPYDAVICNFAVFSVVPRLDELFRLLGAWVRPGGSALICIQNPWAPEDLRKRSFWRALLSMPVRGVIRYPSGLSGYSFRHTPGQVRRAARPEFVAHRSPEPDCCRVHFGRGSAMRLIALCRS
jgi:SAM-dependent methyltransferase